MQNLNEYLRECLVLEGSSISQLNREIDQIRRKLIAQWKSKGGYENFGQKELRKLMDKWHYTDIQYDGSDASRQMVAAINDFANWCETYDGSY